MVKKLLMGLAVLLVAGPAWSAYYDMQTSAGNSGYRTIVYETVTASDFLRAPARAFNRLAFTQGSTLEATVYACEEKEPATPSSNGACTAVATLDATTNYVDIKTGRPWLIVDVTTAETEGSVSYLTIQSNPQNAGAGGSGGGVVGSGPLAEMLAYPSPESGDLWQQTDDDATGDCATDGGTDSALLCQWSEEQAAWVPAGVAGGTDNLGNHTATTALDLDGNNLVDPGIISGAQEIMDTYYCDSYAGADLWEKCQAAFDDAVADSIALGGGRAVEVVAPRGSHSVTSTTLDLCNDQSGTLNFGVRFRGHGSATTNGGTRITFADGFQSTAVSDTFTFGAGSGAGGRDTITRSSGSWLTDGFKRGDLIETTGFATAENNYPRLTATENETEALKVYRATATVLTVESEQSIDATLATGADTGSVRRYQAGIETCASGAYVENITLVSATATNYADILIHHRPDITPVAACSAAGVPYALCSGDGTTSGTMSSIGGVNGGVTNVYGFGGRHGVALTALEASGQADHYRIKDSHFHSNRTAVYYDSLQAQPGIKLEDTQLEAFTKNGFRLASGSGILNDTTIISAASDCVADTFGDCLHVYMGYLNVDALVFSGRSYVEVKGGTGLKVENGGTTEGIQRRILALGPTRFLANTASETDLALIDAPDACLTIQMDGTRFTSGIDPTNPPTVTFGNDDQSTCPSQIFGQWSVADTGSGGGTYTPVVTINDGIPRALFGVAGTAGQTAAWDADGKLIGTTLAGDIGEIGNSSVGSVCASGTCFEGSGTEDNLTVTGDFKIRLDFDNNGSTSFQVENGGGTDVFTVNESGVATATSFAGAWSGSTGVGTTSVTAGSTTSDGSLLIYQDDAGGDGLVTLQSEAGGTATYILPTVDDGSTDECLKKSNDTSGVQWGPCVAGGDSPFEIVDLATDLVQTVTAAHDFGLGYDGSGSAATDWAFHVDVSTGAVSINIPGGSLDIAAHATNGGSLSLKEGADDGAATWVLKAPDGGLDGTTAITHTLEADGSLPLSVGGLGESVASANGIPSFSGGTTTITTPAAGVLAALATPSSANLATAVTDETGSGPLAFATSPTITTPVIATSIDLGAAGVRITDDGDGAIAFLGIGDGAADNDEGLTLNFMDTANTVAISSATGVNVISMPGISLSATTGYIRGSVLRGTSTGGALVINAATLATATGDYDIPDNCDTATGAWVELYVQDASEVASITTTDTGDRLVVNGIATLVANDELDSDGTAGGHIKFTCMAADVWYASEVEGVWIDGGTAD